MFTSTSIYSALILRNTFTIASIAMYNVCSTDSAIKSVQSCVDNRGESCGASELLPQGSGGPNLGWVAIHDIPLEYCVGTAALTTNIIIGDAIVLSRVFVLWPRSRLIYPIFLILLVGTLDTSIVSTTHACRGFVHGFLYINPAIETTGLGSMVGPAAGNLAGSVFQGDPFGIAASVLSMATNIMSTCFIGYRAWEHRALVRGNGLRSFLGRSQVSRALTLLTESGAFYCAIWIGVTVYQFIAGSSYEKGEGEAIHAPHSSAYRAFTAGWEAFTEGGLVIVVAIYPTVIMLLAALNRSECDNIASYRGNGQFEDTTAWFSRSSTCPTA
ncbi:hypothetical protein V8D89_000678 [Ganoderma adspersum]